MTMIENEKGLITPVLI